MPKGVYKRTSDMKTGKWINKGWKQTEEAKRKIGLAKKGKPSGMLGKTAWNKGRKGLNSGEKNGKWIKDRTKLVKNEKKHLDSRYTEWMKAIKNRDDWKCKIVNNDCKGRLEAHHILDWVNYPELRYDINNGVTLCQAHHPRGRAEEKRLSPYFKELVSVSSD